MSTDCESVVSPSIGPDTLSHSLSLPSSSMRNERTSDSGISYEGRVSLISPLSRYDSSVRAAFAALDNPKNQINNSNLHSPPLYHNRFQQPFYNQSYSDGNVRPTVPIQHQGHSIPGSSKDYSSYYSYQEEKIHDIKQENCDLGYDNFEDKVSRSNEMQMNEEYDRNRSRILNLKLQDHGNERESEEFKPNGNETVNFPSNPSENLPDPESSSSTNDKEILVVDNPSEYDSQFLCADIEERISSPEIENEDQREMDSDASQIFNNYLDTTQEVINHGENAKSLRCQFCPFSTDSKQEFSLHGAIHYYHKCMKCEFTTQTTEQLKVHLKEEHDISSEETIDFESARVPRINSQGKVKTFKCKQCGLVAVTKREFWEHTKTHIKSEKLLTCNKCPFVTEYKHHLEYHMRNHLGTKPFKCNKCSYSCVNKSMLNSHMKSHSNIYQYRCSNCTYATKYCHSLKLHLRKYRHTPAMVLNPDGTPNPVPIIDIYGTRRGPKLKKDENGMPILPPQYQYQAQMVRAQMEFTGTIPPAPTVPLDKYPSKTNGGNLNFPVHNVTFQNAFQLSGIPSYPSFIPNEFMETDGMHSKSEPKIYEKDSKDKEEKLNISKSPEVQETLKCEICNFSTETKSILSHHMLLHAKENEELVEIEKPSTANSICEDQSKTNNNDQQRISPPPLNKLLNEMTNQTQTNVPSSIPKPQNVLQDYLFRALNPMLYHHLMSRQGFGHSSLDVNQQIQRMFGQPIIEKRPLLNNEKTVSLSPIKTAGQSETVLDLSKDQTPPGSSSSQQITSSTSPPFLSSSPSNSDVSTPPSKNRRKGRAYKLERIALRLSGSGEEENSCGENTDCVSKEKDTRKPKIDSLPPPLLPINTSESIVDQVDGVVNGTEGKWKEIFQCEHCDIAFKDAVMYSMHMGYHNCKNPFTCNMCGFDAENKFSFFLHIARSPHV